MTKEVVINLSEPVDELVILVGFLIRFLGSAPVTTDAENQLIFHLPDGMANKKINAIIEPCIGAFVNSVIISEI